MCIILEVPQPGHCDSRLSLVELCRLSNRHRIWVTVSILQSGLQPGGGIGLDWDEPMHVDNSWLTCSFPASCLGLPTRGWLSPTQVLRKRGFLRLCLPNQLPKTQCQDGRGRGGVGNRTCNISRWWSKMKFIIWRPPAKEDLGLVAPRDCFWPSVDNSSTVFPFADK